MFKRFMRSSTLDKEAPEVHTVEQIGRTQALTPEGFLLCADVPIMRVGEMLYGAGETPVKAGAQGVARITRDAATLFSPDTIASFQGKPVVDDHPEEDVTPNNWKKYAVGITLNPHRGTGEDADLMLADLLITDRHAIDKVRNRQREVSAGYEADYEQTGEGTGRQLNIIGNHIALVERGRCGPRCAIGDHQPTLLKEISMGTKTRRRISDSAVAAAKDAVRRVFKDAEEQALEALGNSGLPDELDEEGDVPQDDDSHVHVHIHGNAPSDNAAPGPIAEGVHTEDDPIEARFQALEQGHQQILEQLGQLQQMLAGGDAGPAVPSDDGNETQDELPDGMGGNDDGGDMDFAATGTGPRENTNDRRSVGDSAALAASWQSLISDAEVLLPGFSVPTMDAALPRAQTVDRMCHLRKSVLDTIYLTTDGKMLVDSVSGNSALDTTNMPCGAAAVLFRAAAGAKRMLNNRAQTGDAGRLLLPAHASPSGAGTPSIAALNAANRKFWADWAKK